MKNSQNYGGYQQKLQSLFLTFKNIINYNNSLLVLVPF